MDSLFLAWDYSYMFEGVEDCEGFFLGWKGYGTEMTENKIMHFFVPGGQ